MKLTITRATDAVFTLADQIYWASTTVQWIRSSGKPRLVVANSIIEARHMLRHAKRDEEAGGPGLGVLDTRKRTRRLPDGTIVTRPTKRQNRTSTANREGTEISSSNVRNNNTAKEMPSPNCESPNNRGNSLEGNAQTVYAGSLTLLETSVHLDHYDIPLDGAPVSPPRSTNASGPGWSASLENETLDASVGIDSSESLLVPMMPNGPYEPFVEPIPGQFDIADGAWQNGTIFSTGDADHEDTFNLDTGMPPCCNV